jgi:flagellin-like protein
MKGVSEIIAIILILMITISLAALAYTWFSGIFSEIMDAAGSLLTSSSKTMATQFKVDNALYVASDNIIYASIRNTGNQNFDASKTLFYIRGILGEFSSITCSVGCICNDLAGGCVADFEIPDAPWFGTISEGDKLKVTIITGLQNTREITIS